MAVASLDHIVLTVRDLDATIRFYTEALGLQLVTFGEDRQALTFGSQNKSLGEQTLMNAQHR
ncbi:VOC family protein [Romeria aff. gracilis LEGE 07310]|uniref:VOC family protein n=1 Tax=Vasconcelosia minhoensis LEGE 07310 TaxID=915328 RepID=A0A8J7APN8_9CYAN|nr:VOC family protein [Romeria aff. gracilis LEGE 07310]